MGRFSFWNTLMQHPISPWPVCLVALAVGFQKFCFAHGAAFLASQVSHAHKKEMDESFWSDFREAWGNVSAAFGIDSKVVQLIERLISAFSK